MYKIFNMIDKDRFNPQEEIQERMNNMTYCRKLKLKIEECYPTFESVYLNNCSETLKLIRKFYGDDIEIHQSCFAIFTDAHYHTLGYAKIGQGGRSGFETDPLIIAKIATDVLASSVLVVHNHVNDDLTITDEEVEMTNRIRNTLNAMGIILFDHMIITKNYYTTFRTHKDSKYRDILENQHAKWGIYDIY